MRRPALFLISLTLAAAGCSFPAASTTTTTIATTTTTEAPAPTLSGPDAAAVSDVARSLLDAWAAGDLETVRRIAPDAEHDLIGIHTAWARGLLVEGAVFEITGTAPSAEGARAGYLATLDMGTAGTWTYEGSLALRPEGGRWHVIWSRSVVHPSLEEGDSLVLERRWPERGAILGQRGIILVTDRAVKAIGVVPERVTDREALLAGLETYAGIPRATVLRELERPGVRPDWWVPLGWMQMIHFLPVQSQLESIPGLDLRDDTARVGPTAPFADHLLGGTGPITAELLATLGEPYRTGDIVGLAGLEAAMETTLAGAPTFEIHRVNRFGRVVETLHTVPGAPGSPVRTTLAVNPQIAAENALADLAHPAALVAIDASSGEIRALAVRPLDGFNRALLGRYPPGSTLKVVTAYGLLQAGHGPDDIVECPASVIVGGRTFVNPGDMDLGTIALSTALARSCNTTFADLAARLLGAEGITDTAAGFGFGAAYSVTLPTARAEFPHPPEDADVAAAAIGQGAVLVTPLHQATIAAAVASGAWKPPRLLESDPGGDHRPLDPESAEALREMMRLVVTDGTGRAAEVPGQEVYGKTGSAEWSETEPTHAWFIGFWDGLAFAVVVETGGAGGEAAAPIAAAFVTALAG
jgi:cell division protein FtsI/penicillin-binding protein 2